MVVVGGGVAAAAGGCGVGNVGEEGEEAGD